MKLNKYLQNRKSFAKDIQMPIFTNEQSVTYSSTISFIMKKVGNVNIINNGCKLACLN